LVVFLVIEGSLGVWALNPSNANLGLIQKWHKVPVLLWVMSLVSFTVINISYCPSCHMCRYLLYRWSGFDSWSRQDLRQGHALEHCNWAYKMVSKFCCSASKGVPHLEAWEYRIQRTA
jgi:hypothetical protein